MEQKLLDHKVLYKSLTFYITGPFNTNSKLTKPFQNWHYHFKNGYTISKLAIPIQNLNFNPICTNYVRNVSARMVHDPARRPVMMGDATWRGTATIVRKRINVQQSSGNVPNEK